MMLLQPPKSFRNYDSHVYSTPQKSNRNGKQEKYVISS